MLNFLFIATCLAFGIWLKKFEHFELNAPEVLNRIIIHLTMPALILAYIPNIDLNEVRHHLILPILMPWVSFGFALAFIFFFNQFFRWSKATLCCLVLVTGLGNTSFMGFPMLEALFGSQALSTGIVIDQLGSFLVTNTLAVIFATTLLNERKINFGELAFHLVKYPPFIALIFSFALIPFGPYEKWSEMFLKLGMPTIPLAIICAGLQVSFNVSEIKNNAREIFLALTFKLLLFPAAILFLYAFVFHQRGEIMRITLAESAMAPMFFSAIVATQFKLRPDLASLIIFVGVMLSLITVPIWVALTHWI